MVFKDRLSAFFMFHPLPQQHTYDALKIFMLASDRNMAAITPSAVGITTLPAAAAVEKASPTSDMQTAFAAIQKQIKDLTATVSKLQVRPDQSFFHQRANAKSAGDLTNLHLSIGTGHSVLSTIVTVSLHRKRNEGRGRVARLFDTIICTFNYLNTIFGHQPPTTCSLPKPLVTTTKKKPWLDSGASNAFYRLTDLSPAIKNVAHTPMTVILPNRATISTIATASSSLNDHPYAINVFDDSHLHHSLESVATFTNDMDGSVTLDKFGATIRNSTGAIINYTPKLPGDRIWTFDRDAPLPQQDSASAVIRHDLHADFVAYAHGTPASIVRRYLRLLTPLNLVICVHIRISLMLCSKRTCHSL